MTAIDVPSSSEPSSSDVAALTERELSALAAAGAWYANYHADPVRKLAGDESAYAMARRERYDDLISGLRKLGVRMPDTADDGGHQTA